MLFTIAGWMMASLAGDGDRFNFTVRFSMFGAFWLAFLIATLSQFAINDGNYYEVVNTAQNLLGGWRRWRRYQTCLVLAGCGALAGWIVNYKIANAWYAIPVFLAITAPCATVIMAVDRFVLPRLLGVSRPIGRVPSWQQAAVANWPAIASLMVASIYGAIASAILPARLGFLTAELGTWDDSIRRCGDFPTLDVGPAGSRCQMSPIGAKNPPGQAGRHESHIGACHPAVRPGENYRPGRMVPYRR
ncbi:MAG: hypothetical protein ACTHPS_25320 [Streptosporangiaceae bacterium]